MLYLTNSSIDLMHTILCGCLVLPVLHLMLAPQVSSSVQHSLQMATTSLIEALEKLHVNHSKDSEEGTNQSSSTKEIVIVFLFFIHLQCPLDNTFIINHVIKLYGVMVNKLVLQTNTFLVL